MRFELGPRRADYRDVHDEIRTEGHPLSHKETEWLESLDLIYRALCALLYNYAPMSGHPGGSISSGRIISALLFDTLDHDLRDPHRCDADVVIYAAGHKALGMYAMWALRDEIARLAAPELLPEDVSDRLRLEDLLGFRRNPVTRTPLFLKFRSKSLDGHPTPATPFVRLATGASGVGVAASLGLTLGARDYYGSDAPRVHIVEGEGGMTPGRVAEALAAAGTCRLDNAVLHLDWNQASIDSNHVCRLDDTPGEYVQWDPRELAYLNDWNVIDVADGMNFTQVVAAQRLAARLDTGQPTAIVYRTVKGWQYGIEGRASHGAGHRLCSDDFFDALGPLLRKYDETLPTCCHLSDRRCECADGPAVLEACLWDALHVIRRCLEQEGELAAALAGRLIAARDRLDRRARRPRPGAPRIETVYEVARERGRGRPGGLDVEPGRTTTLRLELGKALEEVNRASDGGLFLASADLLASTSIDRGAVGPGGYYDASANPASRRLSLGGICEDAMAGILCGLSSYGRHIGVGSSYGAFIAALGHVAMRLHAIGEQARHGVTGEAFNPMILVCAHAGLKTGEDGPTHADPQPLQLVQENFPPGTAITLTPWEPAEVSPLLFAALSRRPAVIIPFVTRPAEEVPDRGALGLAPASRSVDGVYSLRRAVGRGDGTIVLQGSGVTLAFVRETLPRLEERGIDLDVYHVSSAELFNTLPREERENVFPESAAQRAIGITGFTLPTLYRWVRSDRGRSLSLYPFRGGRFLGSGPGDKVLEEAGLDGESQFRAILRYVEQSVSA